jgi:hypothetical protein
VCLGGSVYFSPTAVAKVKGFTLCRSAAFLMVRGNSVKIKNPCSTYTKMYTLVIRRGENLSYIILEYTGVRWQGVGPSFAKNQLPSETFIPLTNLMRKFLYSYNATVLYMLADSKPNLMH